MEIYTDIDKNTLVVYLSGELDEHSAELVRNAVDPAIERGGFAVLCFDLSRLGFMDSTGIGGIIGRYKLARRRNISVCVRAPGPTVDKIFRMSGLYEIINKIA